MTFRIPGPGFGQVSAILGLPGVIGLTGMQEEIVPTWDLNRVLQAAKIKRTMYQLNQASIIGSTTATPIWNDASDWDEVQVDGVVTVRDADLPQPTDERIIVACGLEVSGAPTEFTSGIFARTIATVVPQRIAVAEFTAVTSSLLVAKMQAPNLMPQTLALGEVGCLIRNVGTGVVAVPHWIVQMISAEPGVMSIAPGV